VNVYGFYLGCETAEWTPEPVDKASATGLDH